MPEPIPVADILTDLDGQWNASNVAEPTFIEHTGSTDDPARFNLTIADYVIGRPGSPALAETPIGNWKYVRREYNVELELYTRHGRQRLYDLMAEVRRVCHARRHSFTNYQRLQFMSFTEEIDEQANVWQGNIGIQFINEGILAET